MASRTSVNMIRANSRGPRPSFTLECERYICGMYRDYFQDPFLHSLPTTGKRTGPRPQETSVNLNFYESRPIIPGEGGGGRTALNPIKPPEHAQNRQDPRPMTPQVLLSAVPPRACCPANSEVLPARHRSRADAQGLRV